MTEQNIEDFWTTCEEQLKEYTDKFNNKLGVHGFKVEYKVLDKNPSWTNIRAHYEIPKLNYILVMSLLVQCMFLKKS